MAGLSKRYLLTPANSGGGGEEGALQGGRGEEGSRRGRSAGVEILGVDEVASCWAKLKLHNYRMLKVLVALSTAKPDLVEAV